MKLEEERFETVIEKKANFLRQKAEKETKKGGTVNPKGKFIQLTTCKLRVFVRIDHYRHNNVQLKNQQW